MNTKDEKRIIFKSVGKRCQKIKEILRPIAFDYQKLCVAPQGGKSARFIVVAKDHTSPQAGRYDEMRFRTIYTKDISVNAMYHEIWDKIDDKSYYLDRAYLHFYIIDKTLPEPAEKEFCLLHCDPNEPDDAAHAKYKQSLHLHIECSDASWPHCDVWPRAHIALNNGYLGDVLKDINSLTNAMKEAILMLKEEVLAAVKISD
jgi:hypothetical protein